MTKRNKNKSHQKASKEQIFPSPQLSDVNPCNKLVARVEKAQLDKHNIVSDAESLKEAEIKEESKKIIVDMIKEDFVSDFVIEPFDIQKSIDSADEGASTKKPVPELAFPGIGKSENPEKEPKPISVASILSFGKKSSNKSSIKSRKSLDYSSSSSKNSFEILKTSASSSKTKSTPHEIISLIKKNKNGKFSSLLSTAASSVSSITTTSSSNTLSQSSSQNGKDASEIKTRRKNSPDTQSGKLQVRTTSRELSAENPARIAEIKTRRRITAFYAPPDYDFNALNTTTSHHANPMLLLAIPEIEDESSPNHTPELIPSEDCPNQAVDLNDKVTFNSHPVNPTLLLATPEITEGVLPPIHTPELSHFEDYPKQTVSLLNDVEGNDENLDGNFDDENSYRGFPVFSRIKKSGAYYNHALTQTSDTDSMFSDISEARVEWLERYEDIDEISVNWDNLSGLQPYVDPFADPLGVSSNDYYRRASLRRYNRNSMLSLNNRTLPRSSYYGESNSPSKRSPPPAQHPSTKPISPSHPSPTRSASPIHLPIPCESNRRNSADSSSSSESAKRLSLQKLDLLLTDIEDFTNKVDDDDEKGNEKDTIVEEYVFEYLVTDCEDSDGSLKRNTTTTSSVGSEFFTLTRNREIAPLKKKKRDSDDDVIDMESLEGSPRNSFKQPLNDKTKYFSLVRRDRISQDGQVKYVSLLRQRKREDVVVVDDEKASKPLTKISNSSAFKKKKNPVKRVYSIVRRRRNRVKEDEPNEEKKSGRKSFLEGLNGLFKRKKIVVV